MQVLKRKHFTFELSLFKIYSKQSRIDAESISMYKNVHEQTQILKEKYDKIFNISYMLSFIFYIFQKKRQRRVTKNQNR